MPETDPRASPTAALDEHGDEARDLRRRLNRRIAELTILHDIGKALQSATAVDRVATVVLVGATAHQGLSFHRAFLLLVDADGKTLRGRAAVGPDDAHAAGRIWKSLAGDHATLADLLERLGLPEAHRDREAHRIVRSLETGVGEDTFLARTLRGGVTVVVRDGTEQASGRPVEGALLARLGTRDLVAAPMWVEQQPVGVLLADHAFDPRPVDRAEIELLDLLADQAALALHRARVIEELRRNAEQLEAAARENHDNQRRLLQAERLAAVGQMAAQLAHDLRTPLVIIGGYAQTLIEDAAPEAHALEPLRIIVDEVRRLEGIVESVLVHAREPRPRMRPVDIARLARESIELLRYELDPAGIRVELDVRPADLAALGDRDLLFQALINLMHNSVQAMPGGGNLRIRAGQDGGRVALAIEDDGVGMPAGVLERALEPFYTTRPNGTGLGLPIVSTIVRAHGGDMDVDSCESGGTRVVLRVAAAPGPRETETRPTSTECTEDRQHVEGPDR